MRSRSSAWFAVLLVPALCCGFSSIGPESRELEPLETEHGPLRVTAIYSVTETNPIELACTGANTHRANVDYELSSAEAEQIDILQLPVGRLRAFRGSDEASVHVQFERTRVEQCRRGSDTVFAVHDPLATRRAWAIAHAVPDGSIAVSELDSSESECASVARAAPTLLEDLDAHVARRLDHNCSIYERLGERRRAIACLLQYGSAENHYLARVEVELRTDGSDFFSLLRDDDVPDRFIDLPVGRRMIRATPEEARRGFLEERIAHCRQPFDACGDRQIDLLATGAAQLASDAICDGLLDLGGINLAADGVEAGERALAALRPTVACGTDDIRRGHMRTALTRSFDDDPYGQQERCAGERAMSYQFCTSVQRFAGEWLAQHCDAQATAAARAYMTEERVERLMSRSLPIGLSAPFDGSLRVLARCAPEQWNELFGMYAHRDALDPSHRPLAQ